MSLTTYLERIERIDRLIRLEATGTPGQLARKLGICKRMIYLYINEMKDIGAPIEYDNSSESYVYTTKGSLTISFD